MLCPLPPNWQSTTQTASTFFKCMKYLVFYQLSNFIHLEFHIDYSFILILNMHIFYIVKYIDTYVISMNRLLSCGLSSAFSFSFVLFYYYYYLGRT